MSNVAISFYLFIAILCAKMSRVDKALKWTKNKCSSTTAWLTAENGKKTLLINKNGMSLRALNLNMGLCYHVL